MILEQQQLVYRGVILFEKITMSNDFKRMPKLFREEEACFMFLKRGNFMLRTPTRTLKFEQGDLMLAKCGNYFWEKQQVAKERPIVAVSAYFYPQLVKSFFDDDFTLSEFTTSFDTKKITMNALLQSCIDSILLLFETPALASDSMLVTKLKELLLLLSRSEQAASVHQFVHSLFDPVDYAFERIIENNLYTNLSMTEFAHLCGMSISTFNRKFKKIYQTSPNQYLLAKKLEKSIQLLHIHSKPVYEVAMDCGFNSISYFNTVFKKVYGTTPTNYRMNEMSKKLSE